jgi:hemerythrin-like domain-containing protein
MRRLEREHLFEAPAGFDEPLEMLLGCHRRIEKQLETLKRLRTYLDGHAVDAEASLAAQNVLRYFTSAALNHHADEEEDLFPLLEARIDDGGEKARFAAFRARLEEDHRRLEFAWSRLRRPLEGIAEGLPRSLGASDVQSFVDAYAEHILTEETTLKDFFDRWLGDDDRRTLGVSMAARRKVSPIRP